MRCKNLAASFNEKFNLKTRVTPVDQQQLEKHETSTTGNSLESTQGMNHR